MCENVFYVDVFFFIQINIVLIRDLRIYIQAVMGDRIW